MTRIVNNIEKLEENHYHFIFDFYTGSVRCENTGRIIVANDKPFAHNHYWYITKNWYPVFDEAGVYIGWYESRNFKPVDFLRRIDAGHGIRDINA
ncbi:hypothetical protein [Bacteroides sp.]|uniref:hypothetical protein n=1 Tax=Bacteroides sp. TaxID=29523 RepID=UPI00260C81EE|nr:hypothetical protein [Bacteroides sp.]MDD3040562.1 hypothetical protein [Bacteroides sp.]